MDRGNQLSVRVPASGWEVSVSTEKSGFSSAKIANISATGAFLITNYPYQPGTEVTLWVKSALMCFSVTGLVLRTDSYGIAIRFLGLSESAKHSILNLISRFLLESWTRDSLAEELSEYGENQEEFLLDL